MSSNKVLANDDSSILEKAETQPRVFREATRDARQSSDCKEVSITKYNSGCVVVTEYWRQQMMLSPLQLIISYPRLYSVSFKLLNISQVLLTTIALRSVRRRRRVSLGMVL